MCFFCYKIKKKPCDKSIGFETGLSDNLNIYTSDETNRTKENLVTYTTSTNGTIYNMIQEKLIIGNHLLIQVYMVL